MSEEQINTTEELQDQVTSTENGQEEEQQSQESTTAQLQARIAQLEKEAAENKDKWLHAAADVKHFSRRTDQERADLSRGASAGLLLKLLPVVDDIERALNSVTQDIASTSLYGGFKLIPQKLQTVLESEGVTRIAALG